jgi:mono/diheme cytochrome c family protein
MTRVNVRRALAALAAVVWLATVCLSAAAQIERGGPQLATPTPRVLDTPPPGATPTIDRLAAPPTVPSPNQADEGAQLFWLHCQPCHGDQGQGLTDEWRAQYPPEDQYCWESGCHGPNPYDQAFQLPTAVPAVIGDGALQKFQTLDGVYRYVSVTMPLFFPGELTQEEYLAILAHVARGNGIWDGRPLTVDTLVDYPLQSEGGAAQATPVPPTTPTPAMGMRAVGIGFSGLLIVLAALVVLLLFGGFLLWLRRARSN